MIKEQTKTLVELWNEVGERPSHIKDDGTTYYPHRRQLELVLMDILSGEFSSRNCYHEWEDPTSYPEFRLTEKSLTGSETSSHSRFDKYSSITLNDFRSTFDWEEDYNVYTSYPYTVEQYVIVSQSFQTSNKDEVLEVMSGRDTDWEGNHDPTWDGVCTESKTELLMDRVNHTYHVYVRKLRLKESVVKDVNVSVS